MRTDSSLQKETDYWDAEKGIEEKEYWSSDEIARPSYSYGN